MTESGRAIEQREKKSAAFSSLLMGIFVTALKVAVALLTGSLAMLSEAAGSGLDLVAASVTLAAVHISSKPADESYHYGRGKVENLSALFEMVLLVGIYAWVIYTGVQRLIHRNVAVDASIWAFAVMGLTVLIDLYRARSLAKTAERTDSQALEADALNYRADLISSTIVILGLVGVRLSQSVPFLKFLDQADAVAAIAVAVFVMITGLRLGKEAVEELLDQAPEVSTDEICQAIKTIRGVLDCCQVRARSSGPDLFVDVHVNLDENMPLREVHELMNRIEAMVRLKLPDADVTVHPEPQPETQP